MRNKKKGANNAMYGGRYMYCWGGTCCGQRGEPIEKNAAHGVLWLGRRIDVAKTNDSAQDEQQ